MQQQILRQFSLAASVKKASNLLSVADNAGSAFIE